MADRRLAVLTTGRQDLGILRSTLQALAAHPAFDLRLWAGGMHLEAGHGHLLDTLAEDGLVVHRMLEGTAPGRTPSHDAARMLEAVAQAITAERPEALLLVGDRSETAAAALAATIGRTPIVHLHGGEESEGAIDNALRHAVTKLAHLHLASHPLHAERIRQMGEPEASVHVVGPAGVDNLFRTDLADTAELAMLLGDPLRAPVVLVTHHPATLGADGAAEAEAIREALRAHPGTVVVTQPNADAGAVAIRTVWRAFARDGGDVRLVEALGERRYWGLLRETAVMLGNSSSGVIEAPAAGLPSITIGDRQRGRLLPSGVRAVRAEAAAIRLALADALGGDDFATPDAERYPDGPVAPRIIAALEAWEPPVPPIKRFERIPCAISC